MPAETATKSKSRAVLLRELAGYASASFVKKASAEATDAQIAGYVSAAKVQKNVRLRAGIKDMRRPEPA